MKTQNQTENPLQKELAELREQHKKVREFIIPADEDDETKVITLFLRPVDMKARDMANKLSEKGTQEQVLMAVLKTLHLGGDKVDDLKGNDYAISAAIAGLISYMKPAEVVIKKN